MTARMREAGLDERGLTVLAGEAGPTGEEAESQLADHHHRVNLDKEARHEGRQRVSHRRLRRSDRAAADGDDDEPDDTEDQPGPAKPAVGPDDDTELLPRPPQTR
jgi:hypothetical protein